MSDKYCPICSPEPLPESTRDLIKTIISNEIDWFLLEQWRENPVLTNQFDGKIQELKTRLTNVLGSDVVPVDKDEDPSADPGESEEIPERPPNAQDAAADEEAQTPSGGVGGELGTREEPGKVQAKPVPAKKKSTQPLKHLVIDWMGREGLTQEKAAKVVGVSTITIAGIIHGSKPRAATLEKLADVVPGVELE